jgi:hypothetical protein
MLAARRRRRRRLLGRRQHVAGIARIPTVHVAGRGEFSLPLDIHTSFPHLTNEGITMKYQLNFAQIALTVGLAIGAVFASLMPFLFPNVHIDEQIKTALIAAIVWMVQFMFGSSIGSKDKDATIAKLHDTLGSLIDSITSGAAAAAPAPAPAPSGITDGSVSVVAEPQLDAATLSSFAKLLLPVLTDAQVQEAIAKFAATPSK